MHKIKHKLIRLLDNRFESILRLLKKDAEEVADFLHNTLKISFVAIFIFGTALVFSNSRLASSDSANLLINPGAESNSTTGWTTLLNGGNGMSTNFDGFVHSGAYSFQTSYGVDSLSQTVDLLANGYTQNQLNGQPAITFSQWLGTRSDQAGQYYLTFKLLGTDGSTVIASSGNTFGNSGSLLPLSANTAFFQQTHTFTNYGTGVRYAYFEFGGRDQSNWAGNYGTHFDDASITVADPDTTAPVVTQTTAVSTPTNDNTPNYTFTTTEAGTISYGGSCSSATTSATIGANTITFATLSDATYSNCTITVTDAASNPSIALSVTAFTVDTMAPVLTATTPIPASTTDTTPDYIFTTTEAGTISYGGSCSSSTTSATVGANTIIFNTLEIATYSNCTITVTDAAMNASTPLAVTTFSVVPTGSTRHSERQSEDTEAQSPDTETLLHSAAPDAPKDDSDETKKICTAAQKSADDFKKMVDEAQKRLNTADKAAKETPASVNLLINPDAENGTLSGWNLTKSLGNGWAAGWDGFAHSGKKAFDTSYGWGVRNQSVSLLNNGVTADQLDTNPPAITFSEWIGTRSDQGGQYYLKFSLLGSDNNPAKPLATYSFGSEQSPITLKANTAWFQQTYTFSNYGKGVRYVYFEDGGKDINRWRGYYGTHFDDASVTIVLVDTKAVDTRDAEAKAAADDLVQKTASWKVIRDEASKKCGTTNIDVKKDDKTNPEDNSKKDIAPEEPKEPKEPKEPEECTTAKESADDFKQIMSEAQRKTDNTAKAAKDAKQRLDDAKKSLDDVLNSPIVSKNLLTNPDAENGTLDSWNLMKKGGNGWLAGWDSFAHSGKKAFDTSYGWDTRNQIVNLVTSGLTETQLDAEQPDITFSEWIASRSDQGGQYYLKFSLLGSDNNPAKPLATYSFGSEQSPITLKANSGWFQKTYTFSHYGKGVRYIYFEDGGKDVNRWRGNYGTHFDDASVTVTSANPKKDEAQSAYDKNKKETSSRDAEAKVDTDDLAQKTASLKSLQDDVTKKCAPTDINAKNTPDDKTKPEDSLKKDVPIIPDFEPMSPASEPLTPLPDDVKKDDAEESQKTCTAAQKISDDFKATMDDAQKKSDDAKKSLDVALNTFIISKNLLANPDAENGTLSGWNLTKSLGNGWAAGWDGFAHSGKKAFDTSYGWGVRNQSVSLLNNGVTADQLDTNPPAITFSEWIGTRSDQGGQYYLKFSLLGSDNNPAKPLATYSFGSEQSPITLQANTAWFQQTYTFSNYGKGVRYVYFEDGGKDINRWRGHYGTHFDDASVTVALVDTKAVDTRDAEAKAAADDLTQKTVAWKVIRDDVTLKCPTSATPPVEPPVTPPVPQPELTPTPLAPPLPTPPVSPEPVTPLAPDEPITAHTPEPPLNPVTPQVTPVGPVTPSVPEGSSRHSEPLPEKLSIGRPGSLHTKTLSSEFKAPISINPPSTPSPALTSDSLIVPSTSGSGGGGPLSPRNSLGLKPPAEALPEEGVLGPGSRGAGVKILYQFLASNGFKVGKKSDAFDASLKKALIQFQVKYTDRGTLGVSTMHFLNNLLRRPPVGSCNTSHFNLLAPEHPFTRPLSLGDHGADVRVLQKFLNANGFLLATSGPGAPGRETEDFADRTRIALQNFHNAYGLLSEKGTVGAKNRLFINNLLLNPPTLHCPTVKTPTFCLPYLQKHIQYGRANDPVQVSKLQDFLRTHEGATAVQTNGQYNRITRLAVIAFQNKYRDEILAPWGSKSGTGYVFTSTVDKINALMCQK